MPTFAEIYANHADMYDELVNHEDYQGNFSAFLLSAVDWSGKSVIEAGIGTGRVTRVFAPLAASIYGVDNADHMLAQAGENLSQFQNKLTLANFDNLAIDQIGIKADVVIEGWAFGHTVTDHADQIPEVVASLVAKCARLLHPGGTIVIIETMGTGVQSAGAPDAILEEFYALLEQQHGFTRNVLSTDYQFASAQRAAEVMGFFFGQELGDRVLASGSSIVTEFTGVWIATI